MDFEVGKHTKQQLRELARNKRNSLDMKLISKNICENIAGQDFYKFSDNILGFFPMNSEVDLRPLFQDSSKNWFLPRIDNSTRGLVIHHYKFGTPLVKSKWGVYEPSEETDSVDIKEINIAIIPALMVDTKGYRLGYGAGFYDRFIPGLRKDCLKITPVPEEFIVNSLPHDSWDIPINKIISANSSFDIKTI